MSEHFILDDRSVLVDENIFDSEGSDLGEKNAAKRVCDRGVYAGERKGGVVGCGAGVELDVEVLQCLLVYKLVCLYSMRSSHLLEVVQVPLVVLTRPMAGEVCRLLVLDDFSANMELL